MWDKVLNLIHEDSIDLLASRWNAQIGTLTLFNEGINLVYSFRNAGLLYYMKITCI